MSGAGAPSTSELLTRQVTKGLRVAIIASSWHTEVMDGLVRGAEEAVEKLGADHSLFRVAGSFELPLAAQAALARDRFDAAVCLAVIIRGGTPHFEYISSSVTDGLTRVQLDTGKPLGFGVLTTDTEQQALDRAGLPGSPESKGQEAAEAALQSAIMLRELQ